ncbi:MAG TPA: hypothetical protein VEK08_03205 [Planctomycetota bacterium]|nr:hypothetical protein [Planctomycetota bacterium]
MHRIVVTFLLGLLLTGLLSGGEQTKPLFKEFMGINGHTVVFKPELYRPTCALVRDYHPIDWDFGDDTSRATTFPFAHNRVEWKHVYGSWQKHGFNINVCLMFDPIKHDKWKNLAADAKQYGLSFAKFFGPSGAEKLVTSVEIGNEPGEYDDAKYRTLFENMARGVREGDPKMTIATCAAVPGKSHRYAKSLTCFDGLHDLFDVINIHVYAEVEGWPTWRRSFPEDPKIRYLKEVNEAIAWRDEKAKGKPIWITEFGWDCSTKPNNPKNEFAKWVGVTDTQQAQYLCRSFMVFAKMPIDRAYIFFFNDKDEPQIHGAAGLTRNFQPKPSYYAVSHMHKLMGDYRFSRVLQEKEGDVYAYEFTHGTDAKKRIWAVWSPTGSDRKAEITLPLEKLKLVSAEQMPLAPGDAPKVEIKAHGESIAVPVSESPLYILLETGN